jgi:hypothetical protein
MDAHVTERDRSWVAQRWFLAGLLLIFLFESVLYSHKAMQNRSAVVRWREQLQQMLDGHDIYEGNPYPNPPIMALLLAPLAKVPPLLGALIWFFLKVGMALICLGWVFRLVEDGGLTFPPWAKAVATFLSLRPILGDLAHGNINLFILFLLVAALYAFHRGRDVVAGLLLALSIACKVTPALFVPYFLWKRSWRVLGGCTAGLVLFLWVLPGLYFGMGRADELLHSWRRGMVDPFVIGGLVTSEHPNQSLPGLAFRMLTHSPSYTIFIDNLPVPEQYHNVVALDPRIVRWIIKACMGLFALMVVWTCRTPTSPRTNWRLAGEFALITLGMLLFSERTWKHHGVTLLLPFAVLCYRWATGSLPPAVRNGTIAALIAAGLLMASTSTSLLPMGSVAELAQVYGAYVWVYVILAVALIAVLRQPDEMNAVQVGGPASSSENGLCDDSLAA